jgi:hypothetical protein
MEDGLDDLEKEVICLRELLSHLKAEETSLLQGTETPQFIENESHLQRERLLLQKRRKFLLLEKVISESTPEVATFLEQITSLKEKISDQRKNNLELKKRSLYPLQKIEIKRSVKKKPLMLEDQNA